LILDDDIRDSHAGNATAVTIVDRCWMITMIEELDSLLADRAR
jgi:hypothetical protein